MTDSTAASNGGVSTLHQASLEWVQSLTEAARNLNVAASNLQDKWGDAAETFQANNGEPSLPDPIKLLRRIHALEHSVRVLHQDCHEMIERRRTVVIRATNQLDSLRELCENEPFSDRDEQRRVRELEQIVSRECKRFLPSESGH